MVKSYFFYQTKTVAVSKKRQEQTTPSPSSMKTRVNTATGQQHATPSEEVRTVSEKFVCGIYCPYHLLAIHRSRAIKTLAEDGILEDKYSKMPTSLFVSMEAAVET